MDGERNGSARHSIPPTWWKRMRTSPPKSPSDPDPADKFQKKVQWLKWLGGTVAAIFVGGFMAAQYIGDLSSDEEVETAITNFQTSHEHDHSQLDERVSSIESRTREIYGEQRASGARQRLMNARIELLLERATAPRRRPRDRQAQEVRETRLERAVERAERTVEHVEADPLEGL